VHSGIALAFTASEMQRTREEVSALLKQSEKQLRKSREIQKRLTAVRTRIDRVLGHKTSIRHKPRTRRHPI
jgi:hypothetical protein